MILAFLVLKLLILISQAINLAYLRNFRFSIPIFHESHRRQLIQGWLLQIVSNRFYTIIKIYSQQISLPCSSAVMNVAWPILGVIFRHSQNMENSAISSHIHNWVYSFNSWWGSLWMWDDEVSFLYTLRVPKNFPYTYAT